MGTVMIRCPRTGRAISTEIDTEPTVFNCLPVVSSALRCSLCDEVHVWTKLEAWLAESKFTRRAATEL